MKKSRILLVLFVLVGASLAVSSLLVHETVGVSHRVTVSALDQTIQTSSMPLDGVHVQIDRIDMAGNGWSYGIVVSSNEPLHLVGSRVLVAKSNSGGYTLVYEESISAILAFIKTGLEVAELVYGDLVVPLGQ